MKTTKSQNPDESGPEYYSFEGTRTAAQEKDKENSGGGAGMKKEIKALKPKGYFKKSRALRQARSS